MKKLFIHHPLFRLLSPLFSGFVVYVLLLLINNNIEQLYEEFLTEELYVCIVLTLLIQELARLLLLGFKTLIKRFTIPFSLGIQILGSLCISFFVVTLAITLYYKKALGYAPSTQELWHFNIIFGVITLIYILLHLSHYYLYNINTEKLNDELYKKQSIENDFIAFKNSINPTLLFESLEAIVVLTKQQKDRVDDFIDHIAATYRYILSNNKRQLVPIDEELQVLEQLIKLLNYLPYTKVNFESKLTSNFLVVPGSVLKIVELIVRKSIIDVEQPLKIILEEVDNAFRISYTPNDKIIESFSLLDLNDLQHVYAIYSDVSIEMINNDTERCLQIPKLTIKTSQDEGTHN